jgi:excinuclease ABC subunit B
MIGAGHRRVPEDLLERGVPTSGKKAWTPHGRLHPEKSKAAKDFVLFSGCKPEGDQPGAIDELVKGDREARGARPGASRRHRVGQTTMAQVIARTNRPALCWRQQNLAAAFTAVQAFSGQCGRIFVSYYVYYQPEAYVPRTGTYIEKKARSTSRSIAASCRDHALLERRRAHSRICLLHLWHWLGETYTARLYRETQEKIDQPAHRRYGRAAIQAHGWRFSRGTFRVRGDTIELSGPLRRPRLAHRLLWRLIERSPNSIP